MREPDPIFSNREIALGVVLWFAYVLAVFAIGSGPWS